jgi:hypothetical protein
MPQLTPPQRQLVEQWAAEGANLNQIQDRLRAECATTLTYMETRMLLMDLGVKLQDKPREQPAAEAKPVAADDVAVVAGDQEFAAPAAPVPAGTGTFSVSADMDPVPGTLVSGKATFTDGNSAVWFMDEMGRFGLKGPTPDYQPPPADIPQLQRELDQLLQLRGF